MPIFDVGDGSSAAPDMVTFGVGTGQTVTVACLTQSASSVNVFANGIDQAPTNVTAGNNTAISTTGPFWLQAAAGVATCQVTGGIYGNV